MKTFLKILPWALLIAIFAWVYFNRDKVDETVKTTLDSVKTELKLDKRYTDTSGINHAVAKEDVNVITKKDLKNPDRPKNIIDTSAANLKIAVEMIKKLTIINTLTRDSLLKARKQVNVLNGQLIYAYSDKYVDLKFTPPVDTTGSGLFSFTYNADLKIVQYQKRKWFLGAKESYIDISSNDPRTTIMGVRQLTVKHEAPKFGLRLQASSNYNFYTNRFGAGPGIRIDLDRWSFQGNYMYYPAVKLWYPAATANFDLIRF